MHLNVGRLTGASLWFAATGLVLLYEIQMMCHRSWTAALAASSLTRSTQNCEREIRRTPRGGEGVRLGEVGQKHTSAIIVVGCVGTAVDGEFNVTLRLDRVDAHRQFGDDFLDSDIAHSSAGNIVGSRQDRVSSRRCFRGYPERNALFSGCHGHGFAWPCFCYREATATQSCDRGTQDQPLGQVAANRLLGQPLTSQTVVQRSRVARPTIPQFDVARRIFFIHSSRGSLVDPASYTAINCRLVGESNSIRVYAEQTVGDGKPLNLLIAELTQQADEIIGPAVQALIGPVRDVDVDGKLAVVLSSQLGRTDGTLANVDGLTHASDFRREVLRPIGNEADVIFLNANLPLGEQLRAVLAHEWAHAAIFGRRYGEIARDSERVPTEDDWLNEALAHLIEVRASGSSSNVAHRIREFLDRPEAAPLVVRDYSRPEFWRHHGCRGAAFSFLDWCLSQSGPQLIDKLIDDHDVGVEHLERATGRSFDDLFRGWTTSLGENLAEYEATGDETGSGAEALHSQCLFIRPQAREWKSNQYQSQCKTLRLKGTTAAYVNVVLDEAAANWQLVADTPTECRLQLTVIPIERAR